LFTAYFALLIYFGLITVEPWDDHRVKRQVLTSVPHTPTINTCPLYLVADYRYFRNMGKANIQKTTSYLVCMLNSRFLLNDFSCMHTHIKWKFRLWSVSDTHLQKYFSLLSNTVNIKSVAIFYFSGLWWFLFVYLHIINIFQLSLVDRIDNIYRETAFSYGFVGMGFEVKEVCYEYLDHSKMLAIFNAIYLIPRWVFFFVVFYSEPIYSLYIVRIWLWYSCNVDSRLRYMNIHQLLPVMESTITKKNLHGIPKNC